MTLDIDSTSHVQSGEKMEGLAYNYKNEWCLDSLVTFDELGLAYGMELRPGNTFSSDGAAAMIEGILAGLPKPADATERHRVRADSAFCREDFIRAVMNKSALFTITAHDNINWTDEASKIESWQAWEYSEEERERAAKRKRRLPKVELAHYLYQPSWAPNIRFPVIIKKTWIESEQGSLLDTGCWKYYAVVTNLSLYKHKLQEVMEHHAKRGNGENFIREEKYGYDLRHFPCQKLMANHAYGQLALIAHTCRHRPARQATLLKEASTQICLRPRTSDQTRKTAGDESPQTVLARFYRSPQLRKGGVRCPHGVDAAETCVPRDENLEIFDNQIFFDAHFARACKNVWDDPRTQGFEPKTSSYIPTIRRWCASKHSPVRPRREARRS